MDAEASISEDIADIGKVSVECAAAEWLEVEAPKPPDQELYQLLSHAAESGDLESLLEVTDAHLTELSSINAAFALIHAARMLQADHPGGDKPHSPKLLNLIRHVENIVMGEKHRLSAQLHLEGTGAEAAESEDSSSEAMKVEDHGLHMAWTISVICWAVGLLGHKNEELLACLASMVKPLLPHLSPHQLQNCLWAFATLGMKDSGPFFGAAVETIERRIKLFSHESLVAILTSFAMVKVLNANLFDAAANVLASAGDTLRPQDIANCTWAFAILRHPHPEVFSGLGASAARRLHEFRPEQVAVLAWAFALARWRLERLFEAIQNDVVDRYKEFTPDSFANVLQAFALVGHEGGQVILEVAASFVAANISEYSGKALAKLVYAIGKTRGPANGVLVAILAKEFLERMDTLSLSLLAAVLLGFWKVPVNKRDFYCQAASKVQANLEHFETPVLVRLLKIFAAAGAIEATFAQDIVEEAQRRMPKLRAAELVVLAKTFLQIGQASPSLLETLAEHGDKVLPQMSHKELASFLRSLSGLGLTSASTSGEALFRQAASKATRHLLRSKDDRRSSVKSSDLACLSRVFARAAAATGPLADKYQASAEPPSELREAINTFLHAAVREALQRLDEYQASPACLVGVLWAASQCEAQCESLVQAAIPILLPPDAGGCDNHLHRLQLPELAELAQALTHLGVERVELYRALADVATACMKETDEAGAPVEQLVPAAELLCLLATAGISASALAVATADKVLTVLDQADSGEIKLPAWVIARCIAGLAMVPERGGRVIRALKLLACAATARVVELLPEERALIFWSLSLQSCYEDIFGAVLDQTPWTLWAPKPQEELVLSGTGFVPTPKLVALCQVHLADLALRIEGGGEQSSLSAAQRKHVVEASSVMSRVRPDIPAEAEPICQALISMDLLPSLGSSTPEGLPLSIRVSSSAMMDSSASTVSIEVDRPGDLLFDINSGKAHRFLPTALRRRLLWCLGHTVVVLPWYEVSRCDDEQLAALLRARLAEVSPPRPCFNRGPSKLHPLEAEGEESSAEASASASSSFSVSSRKYPPTQHAPVRPPPGL
ncbi:unnamed protein product [Symbiodinium natans]|uniref:RNA-editing substrate-binding complex 6 protein domain-containing protein n=1 Tax=Symbiodinium natans TaxID=878477 RepID=A0A812KBE6_9DINO|nr:unnamed protein product [Symbiodinium natans]